MKNKGFTLIELIGVIILLAILSVSVAPKFDGTASYETHSHRAQLISALRLIQQRAMQQTDTADGYCHEMVFDSDKPRYGIPNRIDCTIDVFPSTWEPDATGYTVDDSYKVTFNINTLSNPQTIGFDWMGRPTQSCDGGCQINVNRAGQKSSTITIEAEGYIHVFGDLP